METAETARWKPLSLQALPMNICVLFALVLGDQGLGDWPRWVWYPLDLWAEPHSALYWETATDWNSAGSVRRRGCSDIQLKTFQKASWAWKIEILGATYFRLLLLVGFLSVCGKKMQIQINSDSGERIWGSKAVHGSWSSPQYTSVTWSLIVFSWQDCFGHRCVEDRGVLMPRVMHSKFFPGGPLCWEEMFFQHRGWNWGADVSRK